MGEAADDLANFWTDSENELEVVSIGTLLAIEHFNVPNEVGRIPRRCRSCTRVTELFSVSLQGFSGPYMKLKCRYCLQRLLKQSSRVIKARADSSGMYEILTKNKEKEKEKEKEDKYTVGPRKQPPETDWHFVNNQDSDSDTE